MLKAMIQALPSAARVTEQMVSQLGAGRVMQIQRMSQHIYRALLRDGGVAVATVLENGEITVLELEAVG